MAVHASNGAHDLEIRVSQLLKARSEIEPRQLVEAVEAIMATAQGDLSSANLKLYAEIESLAHYIQNARAEIASLRPDEITDEHLPAAGEELEAIVGATEQATNSIMEAVEAIETVAAELPPEQAERITAAVTSVYEACGFQDITGQRISKVVNALRHIESKVQALLVAFGGDALPPPAKKPASKRADGKDRPDEHLMNGPQNAQEAISQDDIDALLASFD
jgi:chemotaxis protein CheZ